jgi:hypothetical protein
MPASAMPSALMLGDMRSEPVDFGDADGVLEPPRDAANLGVVDADM